MLPLLKWEPHNFKELNEQKKRNNAKEDGGGANTSGMSDRKL